MSNARERVAGEAPWATRRFRAPGRVNLMGDHTEYYEGFVLPLAIELECVVAKTMTIRGGFSSYRPAVVAAPGKAQYGGECVNARPDPSPAGVAGAHGQRRRRTSRSPGRGARAVRAFGSAGACSRASATGTLGSARLCATAPVARPLWRG
jgi:hypothetical protein